MKRNIIIGIVLLLTLLVNGQTKKNRFAEKIWRINFLNPAIELEIPTGNKSTFSSALGIGYGGGYPDLTYGGENGLIYIISPFIDLQHKWFYNFEKRKSNSKIIDNNSGNFISFRVITKGGSFIENIKRTSDIDFAFGPTWGVQRKYGKNVHVLFDMGPQYYIDTKGNGNIWPLMLQINIGFDL